MSTTEPPPLRLLTSVLAACDARLRGQPELLVVVQDFLLPLVDLGPTVALRLGGTRLISLWLEAAALQGAGIDEYTGAALFTAIQQSGVVFLDRAIQAKVHRDVWTSVANYAVRNNDRELIEALYERLPKLVAPSALEIAADRGEVELVNWIYDHKFGWGSTFRESAVTEKMLTRAAASAHMDILEWCLALDDLPNKPTLVRRAMDYAARYGQFEVLRWLNEHTEYWWSRHAIGGALVNGHFEVAGWMFERNQERLPMCGTLSLYDPSYPTLDATMIKLDAFAKGDLRVIEWLHERGHLPSVTRKLTERATIAGHVHVLEFVAKQFVDSDSVLWFTPACAAGGSIPAAEWAKKHAWLVNSAEAIYVAARHGHIDFMRWYWNTQMSEYGRIGAAYDSRILEAVAEKGHIECVRFLVEILDMDVRENAVTRAASEGHLAVAEYLLESMRAQAANDAEDAEGSPSRQPLAIGWLRGAVNQAAVNGHLEVVKWIFAMQSFRFDSLTFSTAAAKGHLDVVQFLIKHMRARDIDHNQAVREATARGHLRVVKFLLSHVPQSREVCASLMLEARRQGHVQVAKWIEKYGYYFPRP